MLNKDDTEDVCNEAGVKLRNSNIDFTKADVLYHFGLGNKSHDLVKMFGDVKFVCMGGPAQRMKSFAYYVMDEIDYELQTGTDIRDITNDSGQFAMFKVGPVLSVSHGMGVPSLTTVLHEITKLMYYAKIKNPTFFRIGSSGGIGVEPGSVIITSEAVNEQFKPVHQVAILGRIVERPALFDETLIQELKALASPEDPYSTIAGKTMCTNGFYEQQGRTDGAFCDISETEKAEFIKSLQENNVINIEMECTAIAAFTYHAGIKCAIVCHTCINRVEHDQVSYPKEKLLEWQNRPQALVMRYIKRHL